MHQSSMMMMMMMRTLPPPFAAGVGRRRLMTMLLILFTFTILISKASGFVIGPPSAMQTQRISMALMTSYYPRRHRNNDDDMLSTRTTKTVLQVSSSTTPPPASSPNQNDSHSSKNPFSIWNKILDSGKSEEVSSSRRRKRILSLDLNMMERQIYQRQEPPISTLSWFPLKLLDNTTTTTLQQALNERMDLILQHNPWLQGRIVPGSKSGSVNLEWEEESSSTKKNKPMMVQVAPPDHSQQLSKFQTRPVSIDDIDVKNLVKPYTTLPMSDQGPLWKITLLLPTTSTETNSVGVILTVSHFVADAHTYYQLYHMLTGTMPVKALDMSNIPNNNVDSDQLAMDKLFGTQAWKFVHGPVSLLKGILGLVELHVYEKLLGDGSRTGTEYWYQVDQNVMKELKNKLLRKEEDPDRSIISTNDILSSWFLSHTDCAFGLMCCSYRNKLEGHGSSLGRNYWGCYALNEFATPHQVRHQMIQSVKAKDAEVYPTMKELLQKPLGIISSWTGMDPISINDQSEFLFGPPTSFWPLFDFATYCPLNFCVLRTWTMPDGKTGVYLAGDSKWLNRLFENGDAPPFLVPIGKESSP